MKTKVEEGLVVLIYFIELKGISVSKKNLNSKYLNAASKQAIDECSARIDGIRAAKRKPKTLKIEPVIPTVMRCIQMGKSSQKIVDIVEQLHGISISRKTVLRFAKSLTTNDRK